MNIETYKEIIEDIKDLELQKDKPEGQLVGFRIGLLANAYYHLADGEYLINSNTKRYRELQKEGVQLRKKFFELYDNGEERHWSRVTMLNYKNLFRALASGDIKFSEDFARLMGGRHKAEKENDHPFDYCLGYLLKYLVLNDEEKALEYIDKFEAICQKRGNKSYSYFVPVFRGILNKDEKMLNEGLSNLEKGCSRLRRSNEASPFKYLNTWGIGLANLAIHRGMKVEINDEYMPKDLLIND